MNVSLFDEFEHLSAAILDETASRGEVCRFNAILREFPELASVYFEQAGMHALLECRGGLRSEVRGDAQGLFRAAGAAPRGYALKAQRRLTWWKVAAAAAALLAGAAGLWRAGTSGTRGAAGRDGVTQGPAVTSLSPVQVISQALAKGLELPRELPGTVRLQGGSVKVQLPSGVELALFGPLELALESMSGMEARLVTGRLVAWVPQRANGFTIHAPGLTVWDLGTIFSLTSDAGGSGLFVFKGRVQVMDGDGAAVDLCEAGEGARAEAGESAAKISADWPEAQALFVPVHGYAALKRPEDALDVAGKITGLWAERYVPEEAWRIRERVAREIAIRTAPKKIPFTKTAWVRPSAPRASTTGAKNVSPAKEENMSKTSVAAMLAAAVMMGAETSGALSEPVKVNASPNENRYWETVYTNEVDVAWRWQTGAASARLAITGMNGTALTTHVTTAVSNVLWRAFASDVPSAEDAYDLTLAFYSDLDGTALIGAQTSRLAVVTGAFGGTTVDAEPASKTWATVKENVVIPYDAGWAAATASAASSQAVIAKTGGLTQTNSLADAAGYFGWKVKGALWGYGTFNLALTFPETGTNAWDAVLARLPSGTMISLR